MDDGFSFFMLAAFLLGALVGGMSGVGYTESSIMKSAYEHGVAKQCLGKTGYHFTCDK